MYTLWFDGLYRGVPGGSTPGSNAGILCYGWLIWRDESLIARGHGAVARGRDATSNVAEYLALIEGLDALYDLGVRREPVEVRGDAKCIIDQMQGVAAVNSPRMRPMYHRASRIAKNFTQVGWRWMPRRENREADSLTRRAMRQIRLNDQHYQAAVKAINPGNGNTCQSRKFLPIIDLRVYGGLLT